MNFLPFNFFPVFAPDQGYRTYQPATLDQLNRLREYVNGMIPVINDLMDQVQDDDNDTTDIENRLKTLESEYADIQTKLTQIDATDADFQTKMDALTQRVTTAENNIAALVDAGIVNNVSFTMIPKGFRITVLSNKGNISKDITFVGDGTDILTGVASSGDLIEVKTTFAGATDSPKKLTMAKPADGSAGVELKLNDTVLGTYKLTSSDNGVAFTESDGPITDIVLGKKYTDEQKAQDDRITALEKMGFTDGVKTSGDKVDAGEDATVNIAIVRHDSSGADIGDVSAPIEFKSSDKSIKLDSSTLNDHGVLDLTNQTAQDIGTILKNVMLKVADKAGFTVVADSYDAGTKKITNTSSTAYITTDANIAASIKDGAVELDGQPGVDAAEKYSDGKLADADKKQTDALTTQTKRIDDLENRVKALENGMAVYKNVADKSVTAATMDVAKGDDNISYTLTLTLLNNTGSEVAKLPVQVRLISPKNTLTTGVQQSGEEITMSVDTNNAP